MTSDSHYIANSSPLDDSTKDSSLSIDSHSIEEGLLEQSIRAHEEMVEHVHNSGYPEWIMWSYYHSV